MHVLPKQEWMYFFDHTLCFFGRLLFEVRRFTAAICQPASAEQGGTETTSNWALRQRLPRSKGTALSLFILMYVVFIRLRGLTIFPSWFGSPRIFLCRSFKFFTAAFVVTPLCSTLRSIQIWYTSQEP
jgi:hypothetical protein